MSIREFFERYGATMAIVAAIVLMAAVLPDNGPGETVSTGPAAATNAATPAAPTPAAAGATTDGSTAAPGAPSTNGLSPASPAGGSRSAAAPAGATGASGPGTSGGSAAASGGTTQTAAPTPTTPAPIEGQSAWSGAHGPANFPAPTADTACRDDGRLPGLHVSMPPCMPVFDGDNGGATYQGVTADTIKFVRYIDPSDAATQATLEAIGGADDPEVQDRTDNAFFRYFATHFETYGREPVWEKYEAVDDTEEAMRAAAVEIAEEIKPFAVWGAPDVAAEELAARGIVCACTTSEDRTFYTENFPYIWGSLPVIEEYYEHIAEYITKRLAGKPAKHAGVNVRVSNDTRTFGLVYLEGTPERIDQGSVAAANYFEQLLNQNGVQLAKKIGYIFDIQQQQQQSTNVIGQMVAAGVNHLIFIGDPLYPIFLTNEATKQQYYPEWMITGTALVDTTFFGRTYDKAQWENAFGISPLWVFFSRVERSSGSGAVHHMIEGLPDGKQGEGVQVNVRQAPIQLLMRGVTWAGPNLTPETFGQGLLKRPPTGGVPKEPLVFYTETSPVSIKDFTEVWWNSSGTGTDETSNDGVGILMKSNAGARYQLGEWPVGDPAVFGDDPNPVYTSDEPPEIVPHGVEGHHHTIEDPCRSCEPGNVPGHET